MTGLYFDLIFVLTVITLISNTNVVTGEQIFKDIVNGVKFGELRKYTITNESEFVSVSVSEILEDKYIPGNVLISTPYNVFTLDYANRSASLIAGMVGQSDYIEGVGASARFKYINGACQAGSDDEVIVVDQTSRCLRLINRTTNATRTFAGQCDRRTPTNAFRQIRFRFPTNCVYNSVRQEIFIIDANELVKLLLAQDTASRYTPPGFSAYFLALTLDLSSENIYLASEDSVFLEFNIAANQFTTITSAASGPTAGDGRLTQAKFQYVHTMTFVNNATLLFGQNSGSLKVIDFNDPPSVSSICEHNLSAVTFLDGDIRNCKLAGLTRLAYLPERSVVMVGLTTLATLDFELVNTSRITAGNTGSTTANGVDSTAAITSRLTSTNNGTTNAKKIDTTAVVASANNYGTTTVKDLDTTVLDASFGLRTYPSIIILTAMIAMPQILS